MGTAGALSQLAGSASGLASAASAFSKLGVKPEMVSKAVPILTGFVTKSGGANVGQLILENFGYRQVNSLSRCLGTVQALTGKGGWGPMKRRSFRV